MGNRSENNIFRVGFAILLIMRFVAGLVLIAPLFLSSPIFAANTVLTWDPPSTTQNGLPLSNLSGFKLYYGTASANYTNVLDVGNVTTYTVSGLSNNTTYYFSVTAYDTSSRESDFSNEVAKAIVDVTAPVISNIAVSTITSSSAVITWTTDEPSNSKVEYGTTTAYGLSTPVDNTLTTLHSVSLTGLSSWNTYHFRVRSQDETGNLAISSDLNFATLAPPDTTAPTGSMVINEGAAYSNSLTVILALSCADSGTGCSQMSFSNDGGSTWSNWETFAETKSWNLSAGDGSKTVSVRFQDFAGNVSSAYSDSITLDTTGPIISSVGTSAITDTEATVAWTTNEGGTTQVEYGVTTGYGALTSADSSLLVNHSVTLSGLNAATIYHFRVKTTDGAGNQTISTDYTFTTANPPDTTAPIISGITTENVTDSGATVTWVTHEPATTQVEYGESIAYGSLTAEDSTLSAGHSVLLSGLNPDTTYHLSVISRDGAGNLRVSSDYVFMTAPRVLPDQPEAISDLRVRPDSSTRNSVILDWTATGADGNVGTASRNDLRISKMRIVEDGIVPADDEVTFSNATVVGNLPAPLSAGSAQSVQITGLETNTVYFLAIKAIDDKGNPSPISNVINGGALLPVPVTAVREGYTMVSFPLVPVTTDARTLLGDAVQLYWWNSTGLTSGSFVRETNIVPGYGYFMKSDTPNFTLNVLGAAIADSTRSIPLQLGWNMIGNPYPKVVYLKDSHVKDISTGEIKTFEDAVISGWVGNAVYTFNGSTYGFSFYADAALDLWSGYWIAVLQNGLYELIITKP